MRSLLGLLVYIYGRFLGNRSLPRIFTTDTVEPLSVRKKKPSNLHTLTTLSQRLYKNISAAKAASLLNLSCFPYPESDATFLMCALWIFNQYIVEILFSQLRPKRRRFFRIRLRNAGECLQLQSYGCLGEVPITKN